MTDPVQEVYSFHKTSAECANFENYELKTLVGPYEDWFVLHVSDNGTHKVWVLQKKGTND